jgi:phage gpG-like protein
MTTASGRAQGAQAAQSFATRGSTIGRIRFDQAALKKLYEGAGGPVAKDLTKRALQVQRRAKQACPVDTGRLRASIAWRMERDFRGLVAIVGTNVSYAAPVEFNTKPFLRPALYSGGR